MFDKAILTLPGVRRMLVLAGVCSVLRALAIIAQAVGLACAIVGLWSGGVLVDQLGWVALFFGGFVMRQVVVALQDGLMDRYAVARADDLRTQLLQAIYALGPAEVARVGSGAATSAAIEDVDAVKTYIGLMIPKMTSVIAVPLVLLVAVSLLDWVSGLIALACYPFIILYMVMIGHTASDDAAKRHGEFQLLSNHFVDSLRGIDTLKAFGKSRTWGDRIYEVSERFREITMKTLRIATLSSAVLDMFATLALAAVAIMLGFRLVDGSLAFLPALAVLIMVPEYFRPIREFAADYHASLDGKMALADISDIIGRAGEDGREDSPDARVRGADEREACAGERVVTRAHGGGAGLSADGSAGGRRAAPSLEVHDLGFSYPDLPDALSGVSFSAQGACKVGVIGASGSGKSTLLSVLGGFADPACGELRACGRPVGTLRGTSWQRRAVFIPQDPYIFHASLRDNVAFYCPQATDEEVARAVESAGLGDLVRELPCGLSTVIGSGARMLSGGERQRVALARAFLDSSRDVLLFDEPTAHLDIETELELKRHMLALMEGHLVFFATHRLHWVANMDYVLVVEDGRIAWQGSAEAWLAERGASAEAAPEYGDEQVWGAGRGATAHVAAGAGAASDARAEEGAGAASGARAAEGVGAAQDPASSASPSAPPAPSSAAFSAPSASSSGPVRQHVSASARQNASVFARLREVWARDKWVKPFFVCHASTLLCALLLGLAALVFAGALMFTSGYMISLAAALPLTVLALHVPSLFVRIFGIGKPILQYFERLCSHDWALRMTSELRRKLYDTYQGFSAARRGRFQPGEVLGLLTEDIGHIQDLYLRTLLPLALAWATCAVMLLALGVFSLPAALALVVLVAAVVLVAPLASIAANAERLAQAKAVRASLYDELTDDVLGIADWVFSGRRDAYMTRHRLLQEQLNAIDVRVGRFERVRDVVIQVLFGLCAVVLLVWAGGSFPAGEVAGAASSGAAAALGAVGSENAPAYAPNWIAAFVLCFFPLMEAFAPASSAAMELVTYGDSIERLDALDAAGEDEEKVRVCAGEMHVDADPAADADAGVAVELRDVTFCYHGGTRDVLAHMSLHVLAGQKVAVLGRSGAGKSTIASLVRGDYAPQTGRVLVGGRDAQAYGDGIAQVVGVIQQRPHLFNQSLRDNLLLGRADASDEELVDALEKVGLTSVYQRLEGGLDTVLDEGAYGFSGGERHRLALARVLLARTPVVILDEPFAGLDPETEAALTDTMFDVLDGRTIIMITHHLQGVSACDRVVFVEDGALAIDGVPDELAHTNEHYRCLLSLDAGMCA